MQGVNEQAWKYVSVCIPIVVVGAPTGKYYKRYVEDGFISNLKMTRFA